MDRDVRFHHVDQDLRIIEARQCARHWVLFHETYTIALMGRARAGIADWRYRHRSFVVGSEHLVMALQPGELHATLKQTPVWDFIALQIGDTLMRTVAADLGWRSTELNVALASAGLTDPDMVRALTAFQATLCTTLYADLARPELTGLCTCAHRAAPIHEALVAVIQAFIWRYAEGSREIAPPHRGAAVLRKAKEYLLDNYREPYSLDRVAEASGCGRYYLAHLFKKELGVSPWQYHSRVLISKTCEALVRFPDRPLKELAREVGWPTKVSGGTAPERRSVMIRNFRRVLGTTPERFRAPLRRSQMGSAGLHDLLRARAGGAGIIGGVAVEDAGRLVRRTALETD